MLKKTKIQNFLTKTGKSYSCKSAAKVLHMRPETCRKQVREMYYDGSVNRVRDKRIHRYFVQHLVQAPRWGVCRLYTSIIVTGRTSYKGKCMANKFNIGDKVILIQGSDKPAFFYYWLTSMNRDIGKIYTIAKVMEKGDHWCYYICSENGQSAWGYMESWLQAELLPDTLFEL